MDEAIRTAAISPLRQRLIDDMNMRRFSRETQRNYIRDVGRFATFLGRSPDTATADDVRRFQILGASDAVLGRRSRSAQSLRRVWVRS
jgi:integrase/recombinase XerD